MEINLNSGNAGTRNLTIYSMIQKDDGMITPLHKGGFCQAPFQWIYYYGSNKSTGKETGKTHLCALSKFVTQFPVIMRD